MKKINNILIYLTILLSICFLVKDINIGNYDRLGAELTISLVLFLPKIFSKIFKFNFDCKLEFIYLVFIILAQFLGSIVNLYKYIWSYDLIVHFISGILVGYVAVIILNKFKIKNKWFNLLFVVSFAMAIAVLWEITEFNMDLIFKTDTQNNLTTGVNDTMGDMIVASIGGIIVGLFNLKTKFQIKER